MQLLTKLKKILYMGFRATLNFRKFKVALNLMYRIFKVTEIKPCLEHLFSMFSWFSFHVLRLSSCKELSIIKCRCGRLVAPQKMVTGSIKISGGRLFS